MFSQLKTNIRWSYIHTLKKVLVVSFQLHIWLPKFQPLCVKFAWHDPHLSVVMSEFKKNLEMSLIGDYSNSVKSVKQ